MRLHPPKPWARRLTYAVVAALFLASAPWLWTELAADGHEFDQADAPSAEVVIVLGTEVGQDGEPSVRLAGRLQTAAEIIHSGHAHRVLVSGDGHGASGDETAAMTRYLTERLGVDRDAVVQDPYGLDTYDTCVRARDVYGIKRALVVTQAYHLSRAVAVCRHLGLNVEGVAARCDGCPPALLAQKAVRDYFASIKAAWDVLTNRPPAVAS